MDVISLLEVVDSVVSKVPIPESWTADLARFAGIQGGITVQPLENGNSSAVKDELMSVFLNGLFQSVYRDSQAAGALDFHLDREDATELAWFDSGQTGWQKKSSKARAEALEILVYMSRSFSRYINAYVAGKFIGWPKVNNIEESEGRFAKKDDAKRLREIGFERSKMIEFLNKIGIPHTLKNPSDASNINQSGYSGQDLSMEEGGAGISNQARDEAGQNRKKKVHRINTRRHVLADLIEKAQAQAGENGEDPNEVYVILTQMAQSTTPPIPLLEFVKGKGIKYQSGEVIKAYTKNALKKYLNPALRGKKKVPATKLVEK